MYKLWQTHTDSPVALYHLLSASAHRNPDAVFVHHRGRDWTYGEVYKGARSLAAWLRNHGLQSGERVGILLPNSAEYVTCYFGVLMAGGIVVALNPDTTPRELMHTLVHSEPAAIISIPQCHAALDAVSNRLDTVQMMVSLGDAQDSACKIGVCRAHLAEVLDEAPIEPDASAVDPASPAQIIYTSGTTGRPKGVTLSHRNLLANCRSIVQYLDLQSTDSVFVVLPFYYSYGNSLLTTHTAIGGRLILASDFVFWSRALDLMCAQQATGIAGVPSTFSILFHKSDFRSRSFPHLRYMTCAGGGLAPAMVERLRQCLPDVRIFLMYGQTEAAARLSTLMPEDLDRKPGSIGKAIPGVDLSVLDQAGHPVPVGQVGEVVAQGENIMLGYWNDASATRDVLRPEGLRTGDMARVDEDGYMYITGRRNDIIKSGAYRIHPQEIEHAILSLEGVADVAVVGRADPIMIEVPVAFVIPAQERNGLTEQRVLEHCRRTLPRYKQVREVRLISKLPRTSSGKIKRHELRRHLLETDTATADVTSRE